MRRLRTVIFWSHLAAGACAGLVILVMCATGAALAMKPQILKAIDRRVRAVERHAQARRPASQVLAVARADARAGTTVTSLAVERDPSASAAVAMDRGTIYVDPYTADVLGQGSPRAQAFFRTLDDWHRWLGAPAERRALARSVTGACNVVFLALAVSGVYLWWPRQWSPQHTRPILGFRRAATGRARDFNWHNVIGFWCAPLIVVMTVSGMVISYPWAGNLVYRVTRSPLPAPAARAAAPGARGGADARQSRTAVTAEQVDRAWARAEALVPEWRAITMRMPARDGAPLTFTIADGRSWNAFARSQATIDANGEVRQWQPYEAGSLGQKARGWLRFAHTGELFGIGGQLLAGLACAGGAVLVWTGLALAWRRTVNSRLWKRARATAPPHVLARPPLTEVERP